MINFTLNGQAQSYDGDKDMPLLWYIRNEAKLKGTKFGCGIAQCGACTVHFNGAAMRSCVISMEAAAGADVKTIESLETDGRLNAVQEAWMELDVPQCGYCQAGQIMAATALLRRNPNPSDDDINRNITNICRCGTYYRIRKAIHRAAEIQAGAKRS